MKLFLNRLAANCAHLADKPALHFGGTTISYRELDDTVARAAGWLESNGVKPTDRVALRLPKCLEFIYLHLAAMRLGAVSLPLNPAYSLPELEYLLSNSEARVLVVAESERETLGPLPNTLFLKPGTAPPWRDSKPSAALSSEADATALMLYTSGTTGKPKGAELTHRNLTAGINMLDEAWQWRREDKLLHVLPLFHVHGLLVALHGALNAGATTTLHERFDADETLRSLSTGEYSVFMAVPTIHARLLRSPLGPSSDLGPMRLITSGSARLPDDVFTAFAKQFGYTLVERYGMTEAGIFMSNPLEGERRLGSVGLPLPGVEARIADPETDEVRGPNETGEVQIRGDNVFRGYWKDPEKTAAGFTPDGWLHTGDLGFRDDDGYYTLQGRAKDLIISGGFNIYPPEIELVLDSHPQVERCSVIGLPDAEWGERVVAVIVAGGDERPRFDELTDYCRSALASFKLPKQVVFVDEFPRNAMGKVQKNRLREMLSESE